MVTTIRSFSCRLIRHCGECHPKETSEHRAGGLGSHTHAFTVNTLEFSGKQENQQKKLLVAPSVMLSPRTGAMVVTQGTYSVLLKQGNQPLAGSVIWV